jgi:hypothetical protein
VDPAFKLDFSTGSLITLPFPYPVNRQVVPIFLLYSEGGQVVRARAENVSRFTASLPSTCNRVLEARAPNDAPQGEHSQVLARWRVSISSRPAVADVRRQWGMEDLVGLEIELGDAVEYPLAGPE